MALKAVGQRLKTISTSRVAAPPKRADRFYLTPDWQQLMARLIAKRGRRCEQCGRTDCRIFGDHVIELKDGGAELDEGNIRLLCGSCHTIKTAAARAARMSQSAG